MDEASVAREKTARALKREITVKDQEISILENERIQLLNQRASVVGDVECLRSEIKALQVIDRVCLCIGWSSLGGSRN